MRIGAVAHGGSIWRVHAHVIGADSTEGAELRWFRDRLRADSAMRAAYIETKRAILARGVRDTLDYCVAKHDFIRGHLARR